MTKKTAPGQSPSAKAFIGSNPARAGDHNQRIVLETVRVRGATTCAEIAATAGLTHQAALNIVKRLTNEGLVVESGKTSGQRGQPASLLTVDPRGAYALGLNIDRDHLTLVVVDLLGSVKYRARSEKAFPMPADVLDFLRLHLGQIVTRRVAPKARIVGLGIAIPDGLGVIEAPGKPETFTAWAEVDIAAECSRALRLPAFCGNDATASAIGEHMFGEGAKYDTFTYVLISAGLGCGLIVGGKPFTGGKNHAGEIGNIPLPGGDGKILWNAVSMYALYQDLARQGIAISTPQDLTAGDPVLAAAIDAWADGAVAAMIPAFLVVNYLISPDINFIGGQLPTFVAATLCAKLNAAIARFETYTPMTAFTPSTVSLDAPAIGAAVLAFKSRLLP